MHYQYGGAAPSSEPEEDGLTTQQIIGIVLIVVTILFFCLACLVAIYLSSKEKSSGNVARDVSAEIVRSVKDTPGAMAQDLKQQFKAAIYGRKL